jgi:hypothetical protein
MSNHTPGPWGPTNSDDLDDAPGYVVCTLDDGWYVSSEHKPTIGAIGADTRLIAAAPEMLDALEETVYMRGIPDDDEDRNGYEKRLMAAIAKAKGETG